MSITNYNSQIKNRRLAGKYRRRDSGFALDTASRRRKVRPMNLTHPIHLATRLAAPSCGRLLFLAVLAAVTCRADDITTLDGKKYQDVTDVKKQPDAIVFSCGASNAVRRVRVLFSNLPDDLAKKYNYDPYEEGFYVARQNRAMVMGLNRAFRLADLDAARKKAKAEKKPIGFIMVWDSFFGQVQPMGQGGGNALAGFYTVFNKALVLVFVRHENELDKVPDAVKKGFSGPDEGGWAPNMAVVNEDCTEFICEIPLGGEKSNGMTREQVFKPKIAEIKKYQESRKTSK